MLIPFMNKRKMKEPRFSGIYGKLYLFDCLYFRIPLSRVSFTLSIPRTLAALYAREFSSIKENIQIFNMGRCL